MCESFSFSIICKRCQENLLKPELYKRELSKDFFVFSFYKLSDLEKLLNAKYYFFGDKIFHILAKIAFKKFASNFFFDTKCNAITINDKNNFDFNVSAILTKYLQSNHIKIHLNTLYAQNEIKYAGKSLDFRKNNPRNFKYNGKKLENIIFVDDVVTTGTTLLEAKKLLENNDCNILFALTLCDAKN